MNILEAFRMALDALRANRLRSALTLLGMVIGVFAIIASVTAVEVTLTSAGPRAGAVVRVDRPFVLVIREQHSGTILFVGKIANPAS